MKSAGSARAAWRSYGSDSDDYWTHFGMCKWAASYLQRHAQRRQK